MTLEEVLKGKDLRDLQLFAVCILNMDDEAVMVPKEPLVEKIVARFKEDVFAAATYDLLMTDIEAEDYFIGMIEDGETQIPKKEKGAVEILKHVMFVDVREVKKGEQAPLVATMADEVREVILADRHRYEDLRCLRDDLEYYANSAAVLYGVVTLKELCELYRRWNPDTLVTEEIARMVLDCALPDEGNAFFLDGDRVCHLEFDAEKDKDEIISDFIAERDSRPRWYPDGEEAFIDFCEESAHLETDEALALDAFLEKHGIKDFMKRTEFLYKIIQKHQLEERISSIISFVSQGCKLKNVAESNDLISVLVPFLNTTHLRILNGWTPDALHESFITPAVSTKPPVGRNDPCPCGSGLKYKKCCGMGKKQQVKYVTDLPPDQAEAVLAMYRRYKGER